MCDVTQSASLLAARCVQPVDNAPRKLSNLNKKYYMTNIKNYQQSQVIDFLRFPLIIGVLFIHNFNSAFTIRGVEFGANSTELPIFYFCSEFFSQVFSRIAVPLFFFISGFLFFLYVQKFNKSTYKTKLQSRAKTLLIPYLFWNVITFCFFYIFKTTGIMTTPMPEINIMRYLWDEGVGESVYRMPISFQFWFIRDLMVAVILTPIIYFICKKTKIYGVILIGAFWFLGYWFKILGFSSTCIFFFTAGAYFGINKKNILEDFGKIKNLSFVLYPLIALADLLTKEYMFNEYMHKTGIVIGIVFCFNLVTILFEKGKIKPTPFLSAASFFVFAIHAPFVLVNLKKISFLLFKPETDIAITALYFFNVIATVCIALGLYYVLKRFMPKFTAIITGGR